MDKRNCVEWMGQLASIQMLFGPKISRLPPYFQAAEPWKWSLKKWTSEPVKYKKKGEIQKGKGSLEDG